jgi:endonuclease YncB( thermonuclease family)
MGFLALASAATFVCTPIAVWDGDGPIWCKEGPKIRIAGIAAREMDGTCSRGHPCPASSAVAARDALVRLLGGSKGERDTGHVIVRAPAMRCSADGQSYGRVVASCRLSDGRDLAKAMLATGTVLAWRR